MPLSSWRDPRRGPLRRRYDLPRVWFSCRRQVLGVLYLSPPDYLFFSQANLVGACFLLCTQRRVIDVGSEWRTFSNDKSSNGTDRSRVGGREVGVV